MAALMATPALAQNIVWDDAGGSVSKDWSDFGNWSPDGDPTSSDVFIGVNSLGINVANAAGDATIVDQGFTIDSLTIGNGASVNTSGNELIVNGVTTLNGSNSILRVTPRDIATQEGLDAEGIQINSGASVLLLGETGSEDGGVIELESGLLEINAGGRLGGHGTIELINSSTVGQALENSGTLYVGSRPGAFLGFNLPGTLNIVNGASGTGTVDLDGDNENGYVDVDDDGTGPIIVLGATSLTLNIEVPLSDSFGGTMDIGAGDTVNITNAWSLGSGGVVNLNKGTSTIRGGALTVAGVGAQLNVTQGTGVFDSSLSFTDTNAAGYSDGVLTVAQGATVQFNGGATFSDGRAFVNSEGSTIIVNSAVDIGSGAAEAGEFIDWDGVGLADSHTIINAAGDLDIDVDSVDLGGTDTFNGTITMNSGDLSVRVGDGSWQMDGQLNMNNSDSNSPVLSGVDVSISGDVEVGGTGSSIISSSSVNMSGTPNVNVNAGATLRFTGSSLQTNSAVFSGAGGLQFDSTTTNFGGLTINMPTGIVDLDGLTNGSDRLLLSGALVINAGGIDSSDNVFDGDEIELGTLASLELNLPGTDSWVMNGLLDLNGFGGAITSFHLKGSDVELRGTTEVTGNSSQQARVDITGTVAIGAGGSFNFRGGSHATPNTIAGGVINGPGRLGSLTNFDLQGHGTINAEINFVGDSRLTASDGTLAIGGPITDVGRIGTRGAGAVLNVANAWNSGVADLVLLQGGEISGATITNDGAISGVGLVSARVINNNRITGGSSGTLVLSNTGSDWDGVGNVGLLEAAKGTLELRDNAPFLFNGTVSANIGTVYANGFELEFEPSSRLELSDGSFRSTHATDFGGRIEVYAGAISRIELGGTGVFQNGSVTTLGNDLELHANTQVNVGAVFNGGGDLRNVSGQVMTLVDGANLGVLLDNQGDLEIHTGASAGRADVNDFQQASTGQLLVDLFGTGIGDYDRLVTGGLADLDGALTVSVLGVLNPVLGDAFTILSATGGVSGVFATEDFSGAPLDPGLQWNVVYNPTNVVLEVVNLLAGDYNNDGVVDAADYTVWRDNEGLAISLPNETVTPGMVDGDDYNAWRANYGAVAASPAPVAAAAAPEPMACTLLLAAAGCFGLRRRR
ncbi:beta strand repeat-containing protein [Posidoniimonas polymericola]|uniref:beta strand repeat-containing protein n=1 Tax=Posidoniimonas polymericola TaxID=2528002 RepID=UPI0011B4399E|nr:hypothetical protein [Posidoniimonas polymericola]